MGEGSMPGHAPLADPGTLSLAPGELALFSI